MNGTTLLLLLLLLLRIATHSTIFVAAATKIVGELWQDLFPEKMDVRGLSDRARRL